jgi:hypothetical protein
LSALAEPLKNKGGQAAHGTRRDRNPLLNVGHVSNVPGFLAYLARWKRAPHVFQRPAISLLWFA